MEAIIGSVTDYARDGFRDPLIRAGFDVIEEVVSRRSLVGILTKTWADVVVLDGSIVSVTGVRAAVERFNKLNLLLVVDPSDEADIAGLVKSGFRGLVDATSTRHTLAAAALAVAGGHLWVARPFTDSLIAELERPQHQSALPPADLTKRQRDVWNLLVRGMSNQEIANRLGIAASTARFHVSAIWRRTGVRSRKALMARYFASGMIDG